MRQDLLRFVTAAEMEVDSAARVSSHEATGT